MGHLFIMSMVANFELKEIACSLALGTAPCIGPEDFEEVLEVIGSFEKESLNSSGEPPTLGPVVRCLLLLAEVLWLCYGTPDDPTVTSGGNMLPVPEEPRSERWTELLADLHAWQRGRPSELQELIHDDAGNAPFPTILFTTDTAVFTNMLYHAAMLLLAAHRPNFVGMDGPSDSIQEDHPCGRVLWHARSLCGIALGSDRRSWDPCMIAAFTLAARYAPQQGQQKLLNDYSKGIAERGWKLENLFPTTRAAMATARESLSL